MGFFNRIGNALKDGWNWVKSNAKPIMNKVIDGGRQVLKKGGTILNGVATWGKKIRDSIFNIPVMGDIAKNLYDSTVGGLVDKGLNIAGAGGNMMDKLGDGNVNGALDHLGETGLVNQGTVDTIRNVANKYTSLVDWGRNKINELGGGYQPATKPRVTVPRFKPTRPMPKLVNRPTIGPTGLKGMEAQRQARIQKA